MPIFPACTKAGSIWCLLLGKDNSKSAEDFQSCTLKLHVFELLGVLHCCCFVGKSAQFPACLLLTHGLGFFSPPKCVESQSLSLAVAAHDCTAHGLCTKRQIFTYYCIKRNLARHFYPFIINVKVTGS